MVTKHRISGIDETQFHFQDPVAFNTIPKAPLTTFFIQEWEKFYKQIERTFDPWFFDQGLSLHIPIHTFQEQNEEVRYKKPNLHETWPTEKERKTFSLHRLK